ncbi:unnamed protein product [Paramecium sonneborni]|uniref:Uncharacterized protein n=1 Tax=Paramecium sonneborni TaxID=65129 RepID=A0A8S1QLX0_9CILI|nr:unnamed protein product [Paramecium sonneborni]
MPIKLFQRTLKKLRKWNLFKMFTSLFLLPNQKHS